jgi:hypothetical protein
LKYNKGKDTETGPLELFTVLHLLRNWLPS